MHLILALMQVAALGFVGPQPSIGPKVGRISLEDLTRYSDSIFVGQVEDVFTIEQTEAADFELSTIGQSSPLKIATVRIDKSWKGIAQGVRVPFLAMPTWVCDMSTAIVGERALFFLGDEGLGSKLAESTREALKEKTSSKSLYQLSHSGYGRMVLEEYNGVEYVSALGVKLPEGLARPVYTLDGTELKRVALSALEKKVSEVITAQSPYFSLEQFAPEAGDPQWTFQLWGDGFGSLMTHHDGPKRTPLQIPREVMHELAKKLNAHEPPSAKLTFGHRAEDSPRRTFLARSDDRLVVANIGIIYSSLDSSPRLNNSVISVLEMWGDIQSQIHDPELPDLRKADRLWIEARK